MSNRRTAGRLGVVLLTLAALVAAPLTTRSAVADEVSWQPRGEDFGAVDTTTNVPIPVSDGIALLGDVTRPVDADGDVVTTPLPVVVTITAYSKTILGSPSGATLGGADPHYLVKRGYIQLTVDARGTGSSPGLWQVFGEREQLDAKEIVEWAAAQPWSNGDVAMTGPSYMGISQLFAAGQNPEGLKAIFPQVPSAEVYRDVVASGGQIDAGFIPLWLGLVTATGLVPGPPDQALSTLLERVSGGAPGTGELILSAVTGGERAFDGPYYEERSTLTRSVPNIDVPTFLIGGHYDLFQRGTPLIFQGLKDRGVPVKMILGPWDHLQGSSGAEVHEAGYGSLGELQLRWFDHYVKGLPDPSLDLEIPDFTYHELGSGQWKQRDTYLGGQQASVHHLSGTSGLLAQPGRLTDGPVTDGPVTGGSSDILPLPVAGLCSRSATQWTAGTLGLLGVPNPCDTDNSLNDRLGVVFETDPLTEDLPILGPIAARLYTSSTTGDGMLSVHVSRVAPDGQVERLSGGWQVISLSSLDESRSVTLDGEIVQPWHPFTAESVQPLAPGEVAPVDVEVFPTGAVIREGDRLRISVQAFDLPHLLPTVPQLPGTLGVITIHHSEQHPSRLVVPALTGFAGGAAVNAVREALLNAATDHTLVGDASSAGASPGSPAGADSATSDDIGLASRVVGAVLPGTGASEHVGILLTLGLLLAAAGVTAMRRSTAGALFTVDHGRQPRARETPPRRLGRYSDPR